MCDQCNLNYNRNRKAEVEARGGGGRGRYLNRTRVIKVIAESFSETYPSHSGHSIATAVTDSAPPDNFIRYFSKVFD